MLYYGCPTSADVGRGADMARGERGGVAPPGEPHGLELSTFNSGMATWREITKK